MIRERKQPILTTLITADLACFALGGLGYGEPWSIAGVIGLFTFLALLELL